MSSFEETKFPSVETSEKGATRPKERETAAPHSDETLVSTEERAEQKAANQAQVAEDKTKATELARKLKNGEIGGIQTKEVVVGSNSEENQKRKEAEYKLKQ